jgi:hypothetical protein
MRIWPATFRKGTGVPVPFRVASPTLPRNKEKLQSILLELSFLAQIKLRITGQCLLAAILKEAKRLRENCAAYTADKYIRVNVS